METLLRTARIVFLGICSLLSFFYLIASPVVVFSILSGEKSLLKKIWPAVKELINRALPSGGFTFPEINVFVLIPLYLILVLLMLALFVTFISFLIDLPSVISGFFMDYLDEFLFIDRKRTIKFFIVIVLPLVYLLILYFASPAVFAVDLFEGMILTCMSHTGVVLLILSVKSIAHLKPEPGERFYILKRLLGFLISIVPISAAFIVLAGSYIAYYSLETDLLWIGIFNVVMIYSVYLNYKFYNGNFGSLVKEWETLQEMEVD